LRARRALVLGCAGTIAAIAVSVAPSGAASSPKADAAKQIRFGTDMARQGNWHEAIFRWRRALVLDPDNPRLHNNIAVAYESLGQYDKAAEEYRKAAAMPGAPEEVGRNRDLFEKFYSRYREAAPAAPEPPAAPSRPAPAPGQPDVAAPKPDETPAPVPPAPPAPTTPAPPAPSPDGKPKEPDAKAP